MIPRSPDDVEVAALSVPRRTGPSGGVRLRRALAAALTGVLLLAPLSGCAVAARLLTTAEVVDALSDLSDNDHRRGSPVDRTSAEEVLAVITGTGDEGLNLRAEPGGDRLTTMDDGTWVAVVCRAEGPEVSTGPHSPSASWDKISTETGEAGFVAEAYLDVDGSIDAVPHC